MNKTGLVLSGGGAKGAYQVGVVKALVEMGIPIHAISGASIGALNGSILASASNLTEGTQRLEQLWKTLHELNTTMLKSLPEMFHIETKELSWKMLQHFALGVAGGLKLNPVAGLAAGIVNICTQQVERADFNGLLSTEELERQMDTYIDMTQLQVGLPLYVSVFENPNLLSSIFDSMVKANFFGIENSFSEFRHIQSLPLEQQKETIMTSAAFPLLFAGHYEADGRRFTDGGQGGTISSQGNTPITPLLEANYDHIIVTHLDDLSLWNRNDFNHNATIYEIRPSIQFPSMFEALLDFSEMTVLKLIETGYQDTLSQLGKVKHALSSLSNLHQANQLVSSHWDMLTSKQQNITDKLDNLP